jgi:uncharacterized membrane protein SirB2
MASPAEATADAMLEFYPEIKFVHILCVVLSGSLFTVRGLMMLSGSPYTYHPALRALAMTIDTTLLTAALMLTNVLHQYPFAQSWLTVKVLLLVAYVVLGVFALHRGRTRNSRAGFFVAALAVLLYIVGVAYAHDPLGPLELLRR